MPAPSVLVVGDPDEVLDRIVEDLGLERNTGANGPPAIVVASLADRGESFRRLREQYPDAELVLIVPVSDTVPAQSVARSVGAEVIVMPLERRRATETLRRALDRQSERTRHRELLEEVRRSAPALVDAVAEVVHAAEDRRRAFDEAVRLRSSFIANISHEIRTPVTVMQGMLEILADDLQERLTPEERDVLERVRVSGENLLELVQGILDLSKADAGVLETRPLRIYFPDLVADLVRQVEPLLAGKPVELVVDVPRGIDWLTVDRSKLHQLVANLLSNAVKFTERGKIHLEARLVGATEVGASDPANLLRAPSPAGDTLEIVVRDTGRGISPADRELIFEAFQQADVSSTRQHEGIGIGLTLVREMARLLRASLQLASEPGQGTRFSVRLPVSVVESGSPPEPTVRRRTATLARRDVPEAGDLLTEIAALIRVPAASAEDAVSFALDFLDRLVRPRASCFARRRAGGWTVVDALGERVPSPGEILPFETRELDAWASARATPADRTRTGTDAQEWSFAPALDGSGSAALLAVVDAVESPSPALPIAARWLALELERIRLLQERSEIVALIGRDVKTPLGTLLAYTQSLLRGLCGPISSEQRALVLRLERTLHRAILSTLDLVDYQRAHSRSLAAEPRAFRLESVIDHVLSRHMAAIELGAYEIRKDIPSNLPACYGDEIRTDRSISNLMRALLERLPQSSQIRIDGTTSDDSVRCDISAAPSDLAPFLDGLARETRSPEIGETLGLRITRAGIESQGGRVELLQGTSELTVRLSLPRHRDG